MYCFVVYEENVLHHTNMMILLILMFGSFKLQDC
jgi:hypothetical protein